MRVLSLYKQSDSEETNGVQDIISVCKELPHQLLLSEVDKSQPLIAEHAPSDSGDSQQTVPTCNDSTTVLENDKNLSHQDPEKPGKLLFGAV